jgi:hypothetical protein
MSAARLVKGGEVLRNQIDAMFPRRDKKSDGWIGDRAHQARASDHNPDSSGWVHAIDIDENFGKGRWRNGKSAQALADQLIEYAASGLPGSDRVKYVVYEDEIASGTYANTWWKWRGKGYSHRQHIHVSFNPAARKDSTIWPLPVLTRNLKLKKQWKADLTRNKETPLQ